MALFLNSSAASSARSTRCRSFSDWTALITVYCILLYRISFLRVSRCPTALRVRSTTPKPRYLGDASGGPRIGRLGDRSLQLRLSVACRVPPCDVWAKRMRTPTPRRSSDRGLSAEATVVRRWRQSTRSRIWNGDVLRVYRNLLGNTSARSRARRSVGRFPDGFESALPNGSLPIRRHRVG